MSLFDPRLWVALLVALLLAYGGGRVQQHHADAKTFEAERTAVALAAQEARNKAVDEARAEEQRRTTQQIRIANEATQQANAARADADSARVAADGLRKRIADLVAVGHAAGHSVPAGTGPTAGDPLDVLADVLGRADQRAGELAAYADAAHIAGAACERAYDSLIGADRGAP